MVLDLFSFFEKFELAQIPHIKNNHVDALSKLSSNRDSEFLVAVLIKHLAKPFIITVREVMWVEETPHGCNLL